MNKTEHKATWEGLIIRVISNYFSMVNNLNDLIVPDTSVEHSLYGVTTKPDVITVHGWRILFVISTFGRPRAVHPGLDYDALSGL
jgi:hypothetical protein